MKLTDLYKTYRRLRLLLSKEDIVWKKKRIIEKMNRTINKIKIIERSTFKYKK